MSPSAASLAPPASAPPVMRQRKRRAIIVLFFLAPFIGEVISGSTPLLGFLNPFQFVTNLVLYGPGALIIREVARRRGLGWANILVMAAAYSVLEEGLALQTWFDFTTLSSSHTYGTFGVLFGTNWYWALLMAMYHMVISITTPILLVEMLFPALGASPWFGRRGFAGIIAVLLGGAALVAVTVTLLIGPAYGYHTPIGPYLLAVGIMVVVFVVGSGVRLRLPPLAATRPPPRLWTVRVTMLLAILGYYAIPIALAVALRVAALAVALSLGYFALWLLRVRTWAARPGWGPRHNLAMITGWLAIFIFGFVPLFEFGTGNPLFLGAQVVDLLFLAGLIALARRLKRREAQATPAAVTTAATSMVTGGTSL